MLVLSRKTREQIQIGENIVVTIVRVKGNTVRLGIEAPRDVHVRRGELPPREAIELEVEIDDPGLPIVPFGEAACEVLLPGQDAEDSDSRPWLSPGQAL